MQQFRKVTPEAIGTFFKLTDEASSILITSHRRPDDDAIGAVLSTYFVLENRYPNKNIKIMFTGQISKTWTYFENFSKIEEIDDIANHISKFDLTIFLDGTNYKMFSDNPELLASKLKEGRKEGKKSILIDHHKNIPDIFDLIILDSNATSATELVYFLFCEKKTNIPKRLVEILLLGILGDTGYLEFIDQSKAYIYDVVKRLVIEGNINVSELKLKHSTYSKRVFTILQELIKNASVQEIKGWPKFIVSFLDRDFIVKNGYTDAETSLASHIFIQNYGTVLEEASWGFKVTPKDNGTVSIGLRSRPDSINVRMMMEQMGIGGGHDHAAGGVFKNLDGIKLDAKECLAKIIQWMETHQPPFSKTPFSKKIINMKI